MVFDSWAPLILLFWAAYFTVWPLYSNLGNVQEHSGTTLNPNYVLKTRYVEFRSRKHRPLTKFVKHGFIYLGLCSQISLLRSGDVATNPGPDGHSKSVLNCYLQNVRSLKAVNNDGISNENKMSDLQDIVYSRDLDIICLTETWLNDSINNREIFPLGYNIYRKDRLTRVGGGVLIAVKSCYCSSELHMTSDLEIVLVEIELTRNRNLLLINCYNPPNSTDFIPKLTSLFTSIQFLSYSGVYLVGDFNFPEITWINGSGFTNSTTGDNELFVNLTLDYNLFQFVNQPTRNSNILECPVLTDKFVS